MKKKNGILSAVMAVMMLFCMVFSPNATISSEAASSYFEKSVAGSTGWASKTLTVRSKASSSGSKVTSISAGTVFRVVSESGSWWKIKLSNNKTGWVESKYCMINLPDVLPSIVYNITNASSAIYKSSGYSISGVTGKKLYSAGKVQNDKLGKKEYLVPVMYSTAKKIAIAWYNAYKVTGGKFNLKIYDAYRPHSVTLKIYTQFKALYNSNSKVKAGVDTSTGASGRKYSWGTSWFLAKSVSTHNCGAAIDVSLCKWNSSKKKWEELDMPTNMHELSTAAIVARQTVVGTNR